MAVNKCEFKPFINKNVFEFLIFVLIISSVQGDVRTFSFFYQYSLINDIIDSILLKYTFRVDTTLY